MGNTEVASNAGLRSMSSTEAQVHEDLAWAMSRHDELERNYHGEYVLIWKQQILAHGTNLEELLQATDTPEHPREAIAIMEFPSFFEVPR